MRLIQKGGAVTTLPIRPLLKSYRGPNQILRRRANESNLLAHKITRYLNERILMDPREMQQHFFDDIAEAFGCSADVVRAAIPEGGYSCISLRVSEGDRDAIRADMGLLKTKAAKQATGR